MRIALVHYSSPPVVGGVERIIEQQAAILAARGHEVVVVCETKGAKVAGARMEYAPNFYIKRVRSALDGCDAVWVHNMFTMPFNQPGSETLAELSHEMDKTRFVNWVHDVDVTPEWFKSLKIKARHVAVSETRRELFCSTMGLKKNACKVVPNGVEVAAALGLTPKVTALSGKYQLFQRDMVLFHPARLLARKNVELSIEILSALKRQKKNAALLLSGATDPHRPESADYAAGLRSLVARHGLEGQAIFLADHFQPSAEDIRAVYSLSDLLFFPSKAEGFGLPLLEAVMHRLPVLCSDIPAHREVAEECAEFFPLTSKPDAIAKQAVALVKKDESSQRRRALIARFSWDHVYDYYLEPLLNER